MHKLIFVFLGTVTTYLKLVYISITTPINNIVYVTTCKICICNLVDAIYNLPTEITSVMLLINILKNFYKDKSLSLLKFEFEFKLRFMLK